MSANYSEQRRKSLLMYTPVVPITVGGYPVQWGTITWPLCMN